MIRSLTRAQVERRSAMVERLRTHGVATADELRRYLVHRKRIIVTVDTIQRDLRAMEEAGTLICRRHPTAGHTMGQGSWVAYNGWALSDTRRVGALG